MNFCVLRRCAALGLFCGAGSVVLHCGPPPRDVVPPADYGDETAGPAPPPTVEAITEPPEEPTTESERESETEERDTDSAEPATPTVDRPLPKLAQFYDSLDAVRAGTRKEPVRVLWLGDSHTAADFLTHEVRKHLQNIAGDAGPGFVRLGLDGYRHGAARIKNSGRWRKEPILPAQRTRVLDGIFGYGGIRTIPHSTGRSTVELRSPPAEGPVEWTVSYRLLPGAGLRLSVGDQTQIVRQASSAEPEGLAGSTTLRGAPSEHFSISHHSGVPQVFGVFVEYQRPGVVFDTVGINGARAATALAWRPRTYIEEIAARIPDLLVLAFGTNEVFDNGHVGQYEEHLLDIVARVRKAAPGVDCWIVGPPDAATPQGGTRPRVISVTEVQKSAAEQAGCAFTSQMELMGGKGSFHEWMMERPAKARTDRIHLTIAGYRALGDLLAEALVPPPASEGRASPESAAEE